MKLVGAITQSSGAVNEDGWGIIADGGDVSAAWVFDGVTGINGKSYLGSGSDAEWIVTKANGHLKSLASSDKPLPQILRMLVDALKADWAEATGNLELPVNYDPPAACLILAKRYGLRWDVLRLGDSCLLAKLNGTHEIVAASPNNVFDHWLTNAAKRRGASGRKDIKALLAEFHPQLQTARQKRNKPGGYSILEASDASLAMPEYLSFDKPDAILLCTDGFYRAVDCYNICSPESLLEQCCTGDGVEAVLAAVRETEYGDADCIRHPRFKPADDATAVCLIEAFSISL